MNLYEAYQQIENSVSIKHDSSKPIVSIKYKDNVIDWENHLLLMARGLVIDEAGNIIAKPYNKFFNYNQLDYLRQSNLNKLPEEVINRLKTQHIPSESFIDEYSGWNESEKIVAVGNKLDGSLMIVSSYQGKLFTAAGNSTEGKMTQLFMKSLLDTVAENKIQDLINYLTNRTLLFEYINSELDPHVISYNYVGIKLHGMVNNITGEQVSDKDSLQKIADEFGFELVEFYDNLNTKAKILDYVHNAKNKEGVVVTFANGKKLKVKTPAYLNLLYGPSILYATKISQQVQKFIVHSVVNNDIDDLLPIVTPQLSKEIQRINRLNSQLEASLIPIASQAIILFTESSSRKLAYINLQQFLHTNYPMFLGLIKYLMEMFPDVDKEQFVTRVMQNKEKILFNIAKI